MRYNIFILLLGGNDMGLFGKKDVWTVLFYEGEVPGFANDLPCDITLSDDALRFEQKKTKTEILLPRERLIDLEILPHKDFTEKYKGNSSKQSGPKKTYYVFNYVNKNSEKTRIIFWLWNVDKNIFKMVDLRNRILKSSNQQTYEL